MEPSYISLYRNGELSSRTERLLSLLEGCRLCPRRCGVNRLKGEKGFCETGRRARVASYSPHFGEEAPLVGRHGSGTIFLSSCSLRCTFCQNYEISHLNEGSDLDPEQLAALMLELERRGCHNINFVTPTHVIPQILEALPHAIEGGLGIPLVYNSSGYDAVESLTLLDGIIDIYMPDFKFWDERWARRFCDAPDYPEVAKKAIKEMHRQVGELQIGADGAARRGLLIRHLVMPDNVAGSDGVLSFIAREISPDTYVNVMDQYRPCGGALEDGMINRRLDAREFKEAMERAQEAGLTRLDPRDRMRVLFRI